MSSSLTGKYPANTFQRLFQKSGVQIAQGYDTVNLVSALQNDSATLLNGLGFKVKGFILDRGTAGGHGGIYIQTEDHKSAGDYGLRLDVQNERGNITSKNKDILISSDNSTSGDTFENKRRLILKGGVPGEMSQTSSADELVGPPEGNSNQLTLLLQGRLTVEHDSPITLDVSLSRIETLGVMSGVYTSSSDPEFIQIWQKIGNVVSINGYWETDGSGHIPVPVITSNASESNIIRSYGTVTIESNNSGSVKEVSTNNKVAIYENDGSTLVLNTGVSLSYSYILEF